MSSTTPIMDSDPDHNPTDRINPSPPDLKPVLTNRTTNTNDAADLAALGHIEVLTRKFSLWSMLALAFSVLGTWSTFAQDLGTGLNNGGPVSMLWGLALVTACNLCVVFSLGELASAMPTALGQAYWVHRLLEAGRGPGGSGEGGVGGGVKGGRFVSYLCAWVNTFGWWTITASQVAFMTEFVLGMKVMFEPDWAGAGESWVLFLVYIGITLLFTVVNLVACRKDEILPWFNNFVGIWFGGLFVVFCLALLIKVGTTDGQSYQPASFVFGGWINQTGWPDGVVWFTGLVQAAYGLTAFDAALHIIEELPSPRKNAPRVVWLSVVIGSVTGFIFLMVCLFCIQDLDTVVNSPSGLPFIELVQETIGTNGGCALIALFVFNGLGQGVSIATTASRLTWSFARDGGIPFSNFFAHVDHTWKVPARALWLQGVLVAIIAVLYFFANTVLQAILSVSTIALTISYAMPIAALLYVGRDKLPPGEFRLGRVGPVLNWVSIIYCCITTVFFFFPGSPDPDPSDMNWAIAVFGVMLVVAVGFWFINGHRTYLNSADAEMRMEQARQLEFDTQTSSEQAFEHTKL